ALDELETEMLHRAREAGSTTQPTWPLMALVARPAEQNTQRLQAILDNGAPFGLVGVLLGQWRPGISAYIRDAGTISSASPSPPRASAHPTDSRGCLPSPTPNAPSCRRSCPPPTPIPPTPQKSPTAPPRWNPPPFPAGHKHISAHAPAAIHPLLPQANHRHP